MSPRIAAPHALGLGGSHHPHLATSDTRHLSHPALAGRAGEGGRRLHRGVAEGAQGDGGCVGADYGRGVVGGEGAEGGHLAVVGEKAGG